MVLDVLVGQLLGLLPVPSRGPPPGLAVGRGRHQPRGRGLRHPPTPLTCTGGLRQGSMKKVLVAGELNVDLMLQGYHTFPEPGKEVLVDDLRDGARQRFRDLRDGPREARRSRRLPGQGGGRPLGPLLRGVPGRARDRRLARRPRPFAQDGGDGGDHVSPRDRALVSFLGAIAALSGDDVLDAAFSGAHHLHVSSYYLQERLRPGLGACSLAPGAIGLTTSLDPGFDPSETWAPGPAGDAARGGRVLPERGRAARPHGDARTRREALRAPRERTDARPSPSWGKGGAATLDGGQLVRVPAFPIEPRRHDRRRRLVQRGIPRTPGCAERSSLRPATRRRLRRALDPRLGRHRPTGRTSPEAQAFVREQGR